MGCGVGRGRRFVEGRAGEAGAGGRQNGGAGVRRRGGQGSAQPC